MLNQYQTERYSRNIILKEINEEGQLKLLNSRVLIAGAGGLGSSVITNLASAGVGTIGIIDADKVELSNLNRQFIHTNGNIGKVKVDSAKEWLKSFNPDIKSEVYSIRMTEENCSEILQNYDIVIDCFDSYESKFMLNKACIKNNKILIHGGVTEFNGQVMTIIPGKSACINCLFPNPDSNSYITKGVISPIVSIIGSIQAMETIKVLVGLNNLLDNTILSYDGIEQTFRKIKIKQNMDCTVCYHEGPVKYSESVERRIS